MNDEIIQEIWQIKDTIAKEVNYNIKSLGTLLHERQYTGNRQIVDLSAQHKALKKNTSNVSQTNCLKLSPRDDNFILDNEKKLYRSIK